VNRNQPLAVVWMDHGQARVIRCDLPAAETTVVHAANPHRHLHHRRGSIGAGKAPEDADFFERVAKALQGIAHILITGPANEKLEFRKYLAVHDKSIAAHIDAVETSDHPSDGALLRHAREHFVAAGHLHPMP
jgi:hypothetical protein